jgi:hypothetical protein
LPEVDKNHTGVLSCDLTGNFGVGSSDSGLSNGSFVTILDGSGCGLDFIQRRRSHQQNLGLVCHNPWVVDDISEILLISINGDMLLGESVWEHSIVGTKQKDLVMVSFPNSYDR